MVSAIRLGADSMKICLARTALLVPFRLGDQDLSSLQEAYWVNRRGVRQAKFQNVLGIAGSGSSGTSGLPDEVRELDEAFQHLLGAQTVPASQPSRRPWQWQLLRLSQDFLGPHYLGNVVFETTKGGQFQGTKLDRVEVVRFPLSTGILVFHLRWPETTLTEFQEVLARCRYLDLQSGRAGWSFRPEGVGAAQDPSHAQDLGPELEAACYRQRPMALRDLCRWILAGTVSVPGLRISSSRYALHHTCLVGTTENPQPENLSALLFRLRRAYPPHYVQPPEQEGSQDRVLAPRGNRRIGISREGNVSLTWAKSGELTEFDLTIWPYRFQGVYLLLALHALGERLSLTGLAAEIATFSNRLQDHRTLMREHRSGQLGRLHRRVVRHTTTMTTDDCGGPSDYSHFFRACRRVHAVPEHLEEVRAEAAELFQLVETAGQNRVQLLLAVLSASVLPLVVAGSLSQLPGTEFLQQGWGAWILLVAALGLSAALFWRLFPRPWR